MSQENSEQLDPKPLPFVLNDEYVIFPYDQEAFKEFVTSLLGKPDLIEGYVEGCYVLDKSGIENLNVNIDNTIDRLNESALIEFHATVYFENNLSVTFKSVNELLGLSSYRGLLSRNLVLTWIYLVKFGDKKPSQRQEITISTVDDSQSSLPRIYSRSTEQFFS